MFKILIVEDEQYARESLVKQIREYDAEGNFLVLQAANGEEGALLYEENEPELVMTDIRMPKMDGLMLLEKIREKDSRTQVVILSAYSDFEYARSALSNGASDYLLKPIEDETLSQCLDKFVRKNRSEKKEELVTGRDIITQFIVSSIRQEGYLSFVEESMFRKVFPSYQITAVRFLGKRPDRQDFLAEVEKVYGNAFWTQLRFLELDADIWALVVSPDQEHYFFQRKIRRLMNEGGYQASMGVSGVHQTPGEVGSAYQEAVDALKYKIYGADIYFTEKIKQEERTEYYLSKEKEAALQEALQNRNEKKAKEAIQSIFTELSALMMVKAECLDLLYTRLIILLRQEIGEGGLKPEALNRAQTGIVRFDSLSEMETFLLNISRNICRMGKGAQPGSRRDVAAVMADYAREHYGEEVSVKVLAEKVLFMNQDYLSHLFAEKKGISFSSFLRRIRMEHARELLADGRYSVTEVSSMTGYNDTSQFIRLFKQETGMTPKKYQTFRNEEKGTERDD